MVSIVYNVTVPIVIRFREPDSPAQIFMVSEKSKGAYELIEDRTLAPQ